MAEFDLVIRNGTVLDGTGGEPREADVAIKDGRIAAVGSRRRRGPRGDRRQGPRRDAGLRRRAHALRRPGDLGRPLQPVVGPRRDHRADGQLRRRLRALPAAGPPHADQGHGRRRGHPRDRHAGRRAVELGELSRISRRAGRAALRHRLRRPGAARAAARLRDGPARRRPRAGDGAGHGGHGGAGAGGAGGRRARLLDLALAVPSHDRRRADADHHRCRGGADRDRPRHAARPARA